MKNCKLSLISFIFFNLVLSSCGEYMLKPSLNFEAEISYMSKEEATMMIRLFNFNTSAIDKVQIKSVTLGSDVSARINTQEQINGDIVLNIQMLDDMEKYNSISIIAEGFERKANSVKLYYQ